MATSDPSSVFLTPKQRAIYTVIVGVVVGVVYNAFAVAGVTPQATPFLLGAFVLPAGLALAASIVIDAAHAVVVILRAGTDDLTR